MSANRRSWVSVCVGALLCSACAAKVVPLELKYKPPAGHSAQPQPTQIRRAQSCLWVIDERQSSTAHFKDISSETVKNWIAEGIHSHFPEILVSTGDPPTEQHPRIEVRRAYVNHLSTSISGVVQLATFDNGDMAYHRGQHTAVNWWSRKGEFKAILNRALNDLLSKIEYLPTAQCSEHHSVPH